ncbi:hypothetical protein FUT88_13590 [Ralstonia sp. TCR112]|uniref:hypothetical protein n=1 Tax=Ralstonia sp. TCR112 TaxID=2601730 RepID=UPI0011BEAAA2|nr:hypothetical protein [Ralstonia sp. TCR112]TXD58900.1 hypothetical protein FUT88_13590 [Ralstonia sp. TCR112]
MLTYGVLCSLAEKHGVTITENVRAFVREVEQTDAAQADVRPVAWHRLAVAWLRGKAADQAKTNEKYPEHAACYENWRNVVTYAQKFADELEHEAPDTCREASSPGLSEEERDALTVAIRCVRQISLNSGSYFTSRIALLESILASDATASPDARIEELRKGLFEARDAMRVMSNWAKQSDPAGHSWGVRMVDRANAVLSGASAATVSEAKPVYDCSTRNCQCDACRIERGETGPFNDDEGRTEAEAAQQQAEPRAYERSQQLGMFLHLAEVVQADAKKTRDRYPAQPERADQLAAFMKTACKWAAQPSQPTGLPDGCKLVPKEPTDPMLDRGAEAVVAAKKIPLTGYGIAAHAWSAMYAAAPTHEQEAHK